MPSNDDEVLDASSSRRLRQMRRRLDANPTDLKLATLLARQNIEEARERGDPRYLGYAQAALSAWWDLADAPPEVLLLRATIRQSSHDFRAALDDLDRLLRVVPDDAQALLTRAVILTVQGQYAEARKSCDALVPLSRELVSQVCLCTLDSLEGKAKQAYLRLKRAIEDAGTGARMAEDTWALAALAEIAVRAGDPRSAERDWRRVLAWEPSNSYALGATADLLLDLGRPGDVIPLLREHTANDPLLLRLAIAEAIVGAPPAAEHARALRQRFEASRLRGDTVHRREEARFKLALEKDAASALELAVANWSVQREPWDARVLLEAALAAHQPQAASPVLADIRAGKLSEPAVLELARRFGDRST